jgi:hypothetical protein
MDVVPVSHVVRGVRFVAVSAFLTASLWMSTGTAQAAETPSTVALPASIRSALLSAESDANVAVAVLDTRTGQFYGSEAAQTPFPSESVVKVLIAANLLATGQMTGETEQMAYQMITESDDDDADALWGLVGGPAVVDWASSYYGITGFQEPIESGWWGNTKITAEAMVRFYAAVQADPTVGPWLINAMSHMSATADDGTDQRFGLAAQTTVGAFKQGWGGDDDASDSEQLNSTGLLDNGRYAVAVLVQHVPYEPMQDLIPTVDAVAAAVAPNGNVVWPDAPVAGPSSAAPARTADPTTATASTSAASPTATATPSSTSPVLPTGRVGQAQMHAGKLAAATGHAHVVAVKPATGLAVMGTAGVLAPVLVLLFRRRKAARNR